MKTQKRHWVEWFLITEDVLQLREWRNSMMGGGGGGHGRIFVMKPAAEVGLLPCDNEAVVEPTDSADSELQKHSNGDGI